MGLITFSYLFFCPFCLNNIGTKFPKKGHSCKSLHKCILDSPRSTICWCRAFVKIDMYKTLIVLLIFRASYASVLIIVSFSVERYLAICHPLHMFAMGDFQRGLRVIRYVLGLVCTMPKLVILDFLKLFWSFLSIWHPLRMFDMGDFQRGLRVIRNVPCQNCQPRLFKTACQTVIFASGVTKDYFENYDSIVWLNFTASATQQ